MRRHGDGAGRGARGHGLAILHPGGVGAPPGWPLRAACQELADDPGQCPDESAARRRSENAAVKRRKARRRASFAGGLRRSADRPDRKAGHGVRRSAPARFGASPPSFFGGVRKGGFRPAPSEKIKATGRRSIDCEGRGHGADVGGKEPQLSSSRKRGPIHRDLAMWHPSGTITLLVFMGPRFRGDDTAVKWQRAT